MTIIRHLRSGDKGAFLPLREGVTSPMRANFTPKITKNSGASGVSAPGAPPGRCRGPTGGLKAAPRPHAFEKKNPSPQPEFLDPPLLGLLEIFGIVFVSSHLISFTFDRL